MIRSMVKFVSFRRSGTTHDAGQAPFDTPGFHPFNCRRLPSRSQGVYDRASHPPKPL